MLKAQKISEIILSEEPLYALASLPSHSILFSGGGGIHYYKVNFSKITSSPASLSLGETGSETFITPNIQLERLQGFPSSIYTLCLDSKNSTLWQGGGKGLISWLGFKDESIQGSFYLGPSPIFAIQIIPGTDQILIGLGNGELKITNSQFLKENSGLRNEGKKEAQNEIQGLKISEQALREIALHPLKPLMAIAGKDCKIRILDRHSFETLAILNDHSLPVFSLAYSPDGNYLISGSRDASLKVWDAYSFQLLQTIPAHLFAINHILFHPSEPYFLTASMDKTIKIWGADDFKLYKILNVEKSEGHRLSVNRLAWLDPDGKSFASVSDDRKLIFWNFS